MGESDHFEWDDAKDRENQRKHRLPLRYAELILADPGHLELPTRLAVSGELRQMLIGKVAGTVLSCVFVWAGAKRRVMSVRPASRKERRAYQAEMDSGGD
jgi:uncharacterized DUF497 family protein